MTLFKSWQIFAAIAITITVTSCTQNQNLRITPKANSDRPNIIYILADDLGYGDVTCINSASKIKTPNMDALAKGGMIFTDAHANSAVCSPTRYGVLTGRYAWRTRLQRGVLWGYSMPLITKNRMTVASLLKNNGYNTGVVGKWHLGLEWSRTDNTIPNDNPTYEGNNIAITKRILSTPNDVGFDYFFGIPASLDMYPYVYINNDHVTATKINTTTGSTGQAYWRKGRIGNDLEHIDVLGTLTKKAVDYIDKQDAAKPFFLYFPLPAPHKPIIPHDRFQNKSGINPWADFVMQVDWTIGQIVDAVTKQGFAENTLIIVTSDNGATPGADFKLLAQHGHHPSGPLRGSKADIFEGGHRVPFIAHWPKVIDAGSKTYATICLTDLIATVADITNAELPDTAGEDSVTLLPYMNGTSNGILREATVHHSMNGSFSIRQGKWKLILCPDSGGWSEPHPNKKRSKPLPPIQLYNLETDLGETTNIHAQYPGVVKQLTILLESYVTNGRSTPGIPQPNDVTVTIVKQSKKQL